MARSENFKGVAELFKAFKEITSVIEEIAGGVEEAVFKPLVEPVEHAVNEALLREYLYNFKVPSQVKLEELERMIKESMGVEGDISEYLRKLFRSTSGDSREPD